MTPEQIKKLPFLDTLRKLIIKEVPSLQTPDVQLLRIHMNYPYFRFVFRTKSSSRHNVDVKYELFGKKLTILQQSAVGNPVYQNQPAAPQPQPQQSQPKPQAQSPPPSPPKIISKATSTQTTSRKSSTSGFSPISTTLAKQYFIMAYVKYLESKNSNLCQKNLAGIYWKDSDHSFLRYRFVLPNGEVKNEHGSI